MRWVNYSSNYSYLGMVIIPVTQGVRGIFNYISMGDRMVQNKLKIVLKHNSSWDKLQGSSL